MAQGGETLGPISRYGRQIHFTDKMAQLQSIKNTCVRPKDNAQLFKKVKMKQTSELSEHLLKLEKDQIETEMALTKLRISQCEEELKRNSMRLIGDKATPMATSTPGVPNVVNSRDSVYSSDIHEESHARSGGNNDINIVRNLSSIHGVATETAPLYPTPHAYQPAREHVVNNHERSQTAYRSSLNAEAQPYRPMEYNHIPQRDAHIWPQDVATHNELVRGIDSPPKTSSNDDTLNKLVELLSARQDKLPRMEPDVFSGELLKFPVWLKSFNALIEANTSSSQDRLYYLSKYTAGDAKRAIQGYFALSSPDAYQKAKNTLIARFGDKYRVSEAFKRELSNWPIIKPGDGRGLQKLADFLQHVDAAMHSISHLKSLDNAEENIRITRKLPRYVTDRWNRIVDKWLHGSGFGHDNIFYEGQYPPFSVFSDFIANEARIACGPGSVLSEIKEATKFHGKQRNVATFAVASTDMNSRSNDANNNDNKLYNKTPDKEPVCSLCEGKHTLATCEKFKIATLDERRVHASKRGLCFGCLRRGHMRKDCRRKGPPLLYANLPQQNSSQKPQYDTKDASTEKSSETAATSYKISVNSANVCHHSMIVPVLLSHNETPNIQVHTYALLDNQSNACFLLESVASQFTIKPEPVNLRLTTMMDTRVTNSQIVNGLVVRGINEQTELPLPATYTRASIPVDGDLIPRPETVKQWPHLKHIAQNLPPYDETIDVGLLIGFNCSGAMLPRQVIAGRDHEPYAVRTILGWSVTGQMSHDDESNPMSSVKENDFVSHFAFRTQVKEVSPDQIRQMYENEFVEAKTDQKLSIEDKRFLKVVDEGIYKRDDGHFELPLPFKKEIHLPNNRQLVESRLKGLRTKLMKNHRFRQDYFRFMQDMIDKGYAEQVKDDGISGQVWYLPHHGVYHPKRPEKIRVVFDCSVEFKGEVLNHNLMQGPDMINNLTGVLCRFRKEHIAIVCDIASMFHQVGVTPSHRDFFRFLWFEGNDLDGPIIEYRMTVHLFGATSSPGCANFALKKTADTYENEFGTQAANFVRRNFYVDDGLTSTATESEAKELIHSSRELCRRGGFELHKFLCTNKDILKEIPSEQQAKDVQKLDINCTKLPVSRALGVQWDVENDEFLFIIDDKEMPITRRNILSTVSSIYDPLGLVSPLLLTGRNILQVICRDGLSWDDPVSDNIETAWLKWKEELKLLSKLHVRRCYKPKEFSSVKEVQLHHFSDASEKGYGQCSYIRLIDDNDNVSTSLIMARSRVTPSKVVTMPRLELTAAALSVKVAQFLDKELDYKAIKHVFWTDSKVVLGYVANEARRFHVFVANRVQMIRNFSSPDQWNYVSTSENPADLASRGITAEEIISKSLWWNGPKFLTSHQIVPGEIQATLSPDDPEIKATVHTVKTEHAEMTESFYLPSRIGHISSWHRAKVVIALCLRLKERFIKRQVKYVHCERTKVPREIKYSPLSVEELEASENIILHALQEKEFRDVLSAETLSERAKIQPNTRLSRLDPFIAKDGLIRVGGRLRRADVPYQVAHPVILPKVSHITKLIISHYHVLTCHSGTNTTLSEIRASGYWIIKSRASVSSYIWNCVTCRKLRGARMEQKTADLPEDRLEPAPPFTYAGVDLFGPFYIKEGRSEKKRWCALFTCLVSRAIHIEVTHTLSTDSFLSAYRRFIGRRGRIRVLRSDRGTNFVGAKSELHSALKEMDSSKIKEELLKTDCDWINFKMNVPHASHMGGAWERLIRSTRSVLSSLLMKHGSQLDDESLLTLMVEAENVVNSRPLSYCDMSSPDSLEPLSPIQLLTLKSKVVQPPPGLFVKEDMYSRKRWRRVQHLANEFWTRWRKEYMLTLQERQKWKRPRENALVGDIVLISEDNCPRNEWPLGRITETTESKDGLVRKVKVRTSTSVFERPVQKLVLLHRP